MQLALLLYISLSHVLPILASVCENVSPIDTSEDDKVLLQKGQPSRAASEALTETWKLPDMFVHGVQQRETEASGAIIPSLNTTSSHSLVDKSTHMMVSMPSSLAFGESKLNASLMPASTVQLVSTARGSINASGNTSQFHNNIQKTVENSSAHTISSMPSSRAIVEESKRRAEAVETAGVSSKQGSANSDTWHPLSSLQRRGISVERRTQRRWRNHKQAPEGEECWDVDYEYGNMEKGSCDNANLVALHCKRPCLEEVHQQPWFQQNLPTREVDYKKAEHCHQACLHTAVCEFWVFDTRPGMFENACWMKQAVHCDSPFGDAPGFISGPAQCDTIRRAHANQKHLVGKTDSRSRIIADKSESKRQHGTRSQFGPWFIHITMFLLEVLTGGACLAGVACFALWRQKVDQEKPESAVSEEPRMNYRIQAVCKDAHRSKQLADTLKDFAAPISPHQFEPERASFASSSKESAESARTAAYDY